MQPEFFHGVRAPTSGRKRNVPDDRRTEKSCVLVLNKEKHLKLQKYSVLIMEQLKENINCNFNCCFVHIDEVFVNLFKVKGFAFGIWDFFVFVFFFVFGL